MKSAISFIKTTVIGGVIFLVPFFIIVIIILKAGELTGRAIHPWVVKFGIDNFAGKTTIALLVDGILIMISFIAGIIVRSGKINSRFPVIDSMVNKFIPGYEVLRAQSSERGAAGVVDPWQAILLEMEDGWGVVFIVDFNPGKYSAVFIPHAPRIESGEIRLFRLDSMEQVLITARQARQYLRRFGAGAPEILNGR